MTPRHRPLAIWALGMTMLIAGCGATPQTTTSVDPSTAATVPPPSGTDATLAASPSSTASASAGGPPSIAWTEHQFDAPAGPVIADGDRFVVVGSETEDRAAWTSTDGLSWERHPVPAPSEADCAADAPFCIVRSARLGPMVRLHDTLYSFGNTEFLNDFIRGVGWRWTDGQEWQEIQSESPIYGGGAFRAVTTSDEAIFAATHAGYPLTERHWLWKPDTSWQQVDDEISTGNPNQFRSVAWQDGRFLAVAATWDVPSDFMADDTHPSAFLSTDGATWTETSVPSGATALCSVTATRDGFFVLGADADGHPVAWRTPDGVDWSAGPLPTEVSVEVGTDISIGGCSGKVIELAAGYLAFLPSGDATITWTSGDGATWEEGPVLDMRTGSEPIAAIDDTIVAFGRRGALDGPDSTQVLFVGTVGPPDE